MSSSMADKVEAAAKELGYQFARRQDIEALMRPGR